MQPVSAIARPGRARFQGISSRNLPNTFCSALARTVQVMSTAMSESSSAVSGMQPMSAMLRGELLAVGVVHLAADVPEVDARRPPEHRHLRLAPRRARDQRERPETASGVAEDRNRAGIVEA